MNGAGYVGQADSLKGIGNFKGSLQAYSKALEIDKNIGSSILLKRGILLYQLKNFQAALTDFAKVSINLIVLVAGTKWWGHESSLLQREDLQAARPW